MVAPFSLFPIFAPYKHWRPSTSTRVVENTHVRHRLEQVDPTCLPFMSVWYCEGFLEFEAQRWSPGQAQHMYAQTCRHLEQMLNWSFAKGISLLDWDHLDFREFLEFRCLPPVTWCESAIFTKYLPQPGTSFEEWEINERWLPFIRTTNSAGASGTSKRDLERSAEVAREFFTFYLAKTGRTQTGHKQAAQGLAKTNCAADLPPDIVQSSAISKPLLRHSQHELDWVFDDLANGHTAVLRSKSSFT